VTVSYRLRKNYMVDIYDIEEEQFQIESGLRYGTFMSVSRAVFYFSKNPVPYHIIHGYKYFVLILPVLYPRAPFVFDKFYVFDMFPWNNNQADESTLI
jgi:hypothetical protein